MQQFHGVEESHSCIPCYPMAAKRKETRTSASSKLHQRVDDHNYDDPPSKLRTMIRSSNCDLGTALMAYWRGDPNYFRLFPSRQSMKEDGTADVALFDVLVEIEKRVLDGKYKSYSIAFDPFKDMGRTNWAENHYEFDWDEFYCDLPVEMYGIPSVRKLNRVRPDSDRPVGLCHIAEATDSDYPPKAQAAMDFLEKHNREGAYAGVFIEDRDDGWNTPGIHVSFEHQKVPEKIFEELRDIRGIVSLKFGEKSTDSVLKYLKYTPELLKLEIDGTFTSRGIRRLKLVPKLQQLTISFREKSTNAKWFDALPEFSELIEISIYSGEISRFPVETVAKLGQLERMTFFCTFPPATDFQPLQNSKLRELSIGSRKIGDAHIPAIVSLAKIKTLKYLSLADAQFSTEGSKELRKVFKSKLVE